MSKQLEIRSELLRYLETARSMRDRGVLSSGIKAVMLEHDIRELDKGHEFDDNHPKHWEKILHRQ